MARRWDYYFREATSGFKRNGLVAFAAISTVFIALFLLGLTLLVRREVNLIIDSVGDRVEISIFLSDSISASQQASLSERLASMPEVGEVRYESKQDAYERAKILFRDNPSILENLTPDALPASFRVRLVDAETDFRAISAQLGEDLAGLGISEIVDQRETLDKVFKLTSIFRNGMLIVALIMLVSSGLLIANTVRVGLYARRKEIGIMKLVGATNWFIRLPFLIEGVVAALVGAILAIVVLAALMAWFVTPIRGNFLGLPLVGTPDLLVIVPWLLGAAIVVALVASFAGMRRFLDI